ncbi:MAG: hypothetical protein ACR2FF_05590 [Mycobacteriales bacterium]
MTAATLPSVHSASNAPGAARAFRAILRRDIYVTGRELPTFAIQVILQPLFMLFVFGKILGTIGYTRGGFVQLLFPGVVAFTCVLPRCNRRRSRWCSTSVSRRRSKTGCSPRFRCGRSPSRK